MLPHIYQVQIREEVQHDADELEEEEDDEAAAAALHLHDDEDDLLLLLLPSYSVYD